MHPGALIAGRYRLHALVGAGAMGQVWRGLDERLQREVAVKVVDLADSTGPVTAGRFQREAMATARLNHPNIVTTFDGGIEGDTAYLVMELLDGTPLSSRLHGGPLPIGEATGIGAEIARALEATHLIGVVHADIKPGNVMLTRAGQVKVLDFGIARLTAEATDVATQPADALGTAAYMSPEQAQGRPVGPASDLYSLGCLLFTMVAGHPPFPGTDALAVARQQVAALPPRLMQVRPDTPPALDALVAALLAKDPAARPTAVAAAQALSSGGPAQTAVLPAQTAVLPAQTAVLPPQTAVLPPQTAALPPRAAAPVGSARVSDVGADPRAVAAHGHHRPAWFGRGVKGVLLAIVGLGLVGLVWFGGTRLAALLPQPGAAASKAPTTTRATTKPPVTPAKPSTQAPGVQLPTIQLPTIQLPTIPSVGDAALAGVVGGVSTALDSWSPQGKDAVQAKAALQREWGKASAKILAGQDPKAQLASFEASVEKLHEKDAIPRGTYLSLQVAIQAVRALL